MKREASYQKILLLALGLLLAVCRGAVADIGFELFSWKEGKEWNYAIFEGTSTVRSLQLFRSKNNRLKNITFLKGRIASLPSGERLYWREDKAMGLMLPSKEIIQDIVTFAATSNIEVYLPGETGDSKALQELQKETRDLLDL